MDIAVGNSREPAVEYPKEPPQRTARFALGSQEERGEGGAEGQRVEGRDEHGNGDGHRELLVHPARDAGNERGGDEDGGQDEGDGYHRTRHLFHGLQGGVVRRQPLLHVVLHRLHHHDGVVHDEADGQHEAEERQGVDGEAEQGEEHEGTHQGDGHREQRDEGRPEALEEDEDDDHHQDQGLEEGVEDFRDALAHRQGGVEGNHVVEVVGKPRLGLVHELGRGLHGVDGVGARQLVDGDDGAGAAVEPSLVGVVLRAELDPRQVPHPNDGAVGGGLDHHVLEVRHAL